MNRSILSLLLILNSFLLYSQTEMESTKKEIHKVMKAQEAAWNQGDVESFMKAYWKSDSLLFVGSSGPRYGWKETLAKYKSSYPDQESMGKLTFSNNTFQLIDETNVHLGGKWTLERKSDTLQGYYSLLWKRLEGEWKIVYDHSSSTKK